MDLSFAAGEVNDAQSRPQCVGLRLCLNGLCLQWGNQGCFLPRHVFFSLLSRGDAVVSPPL